MRNLLGFEASAPDTSVGEIARDAINVHALTDRETASREFLSHRLIAMPIVDEEDRLVGILTMNDVLDIVEEEGAEDMARSSGSEPLDRSYLSSTIIRLVRSRIVWLPVLAVSAILTVRVLEMYEDRLDQVVVLALFIPLLTGTGGNTGNQAATTVTRALARPWERYGSGTSGASFGGSCGSVPFWAESGCSSRASSTGGRSALSSA